MTSSMPHSCGDQCGEQRGPGCPHTCPGICHPCIHRRCQQAHATALAVKEMKDEDDDNDDETAWAFEFSDCDIRELSLSEQAISEYHFSFFTRLVRWLERHGLGEIEPVLCEWDVFRRSDLKRLCPDEVEELLEELEACEVDKVTQRKKTIHTLLDLSLGPCRRYLQHYILVFCG